MLCTAAISWGGTAPWRPTHENHPATKWVAHSVVNWLWLHELAYNLFREYLYRYEHLGRTTHKSWEAIQKIEYSYRDAPNKQLVRPSPRPLCMPDKYKKINALKSYRNFYLYGKTDILVYTRREPPAWMEWDLIDA